MDIICFLYNLVYFYSFQVLLSEGIYWLHHSAKGLWHSKRVRTQRPVKHGAYSLLQRTLLQVPTVSLCRMAVWKSPFIVHSQGSSLFPQGLFEVSFGSHRSLFAFTLCPSVWALLKDLHLMTSPLLCLWDLLCPWSWFPGFINTLLPLHSSLASGSIIVPPPPSFQAHSMCPDSSHRSLRVFKWRKWDWCSKEVLGCFCCCCCCWLGWGSSNNSKWENRKSLALSQDILTHSTVSGRTTSLWSPESLNRQWIRCFLLGIHRRSTQRAGVCGMRQARELKERLSSLESWLPFTSHVTLDKLFNLSLPQFLHL